MLSSLIPALFTLFLIVSLAVVIQSLIRARSVWKVLRREIAVLDNGAIGVPAIGPSRLLPRRSPVTANQTVGRGRSAVGSGARSGALTGWPTSAPTLAAA